MKSTTPLFLAATVLLGASNVAAAATSFPDLAGCFSSTTGLTYKGKPDFNSRGSCGGVCRTAKFSVYAMNGGDCYCGQKLPPLTTKGDASQCAVSCPGYPDDLCGGNGFYSVYYTSGTASGITNSDPAATDVPAPGASSTTSAKPSVVTLGGPTVVVTAPGSASNASSSAGPSKAGIAAGVVVGLIALAAIAGGVFLYLRNKKRREVEEEFRRQAAVSTFINGGKAPSSSGGASFSDMRLDPAVMAQRRMSDGSIADNQDYSRRILKVTNA